LFIELENHGYAFFGVGVGVGIGQVLICLFLPCLCGQRAFALAMYIDQLMKILSEICLF
jgi:hypothetical protein